MTRMDAKRYTRTVADAHRPYPEEFILGRRIAPDVVAVRVGAAPERSHVVRNGALPAPVHTRVGPIVTAIGSCGRLAHVEVIEANRYMFQFD